MDIKKPKHFIVFKIIGFIGIVATIVGFILSFSGFGNFESNNFMIGSILVPFGMLIGIGGLVIGFSPEISKMSTKSTKYIINENKDDLIDITKTSADIVEDSGKRIGYISGYQRNGNGGKNRSDRNCKEDVYGFCSIYGKRKCVDKQRFFRICCVPFSTAYGDCLFTVGGTETMVEEYLALCIDWSFAHWAADCY